MFVGKSTATLFLVFAEKHNVFRIEKHPLQEFKELSLHRAFFKNMGMRVSFTKTLSGCQATADLSVGDSRTQNFANTQSGERSERDREMTASISE